MSYVRHGISPSVFGVAKIIFCSFVQAQSQKYDVATVVIIISHNNVLEKAKVVARVDKCEYNIC